MSEEIEFLQTALGILEDYEWDSGDDPEQTEQEPVAWKVIDETNDGAFMFSEVKPMERYYKDYVVIPLYTAQQKREPLSDDEMIAIWKEGIRCEIPFVEIGRAIEKAHGIRGGE